MKKSTDAADARWFLRNVFHVCEGRRGCETLNVLDDPRTGFGDDRCEATFCRDSRWLLVRLGREATQVLDVATGRALGEPIRYGGVCAVFVGDGFEVLTAGEDGSAEIVPVAPRDVPATALAETAEVLGGYRVNAQASLEPSPDRQQRRAGLRSLAPERRRDRFVTSVYSLRADD